MTSKEEKKQTKKYLRTLMKDKSHPFRSFLRIFKYGIKSFGRNVWLSLASILVMTITLLILFVTIIASTILTETAATIQDKIDITIYLKPATTNDDLEKLSKILSTNSNIKTDTIHSNSAEEEIEIFLNENKDNQELISTLQEEDMKEIMRNTMQSTIRFKINNIDNLEETKSFIETNELFSKHIDETKPATYDENQTEIQTINSWAKIAKNAGLILAIIFTTVSVLVIFNTIRMAIFSRREEIYMMKLVGASKKFIRGPFLIEAGFSGVISGIISAILSCIGFNIASIKLQEFGISTEKVQLIFTNNLYTILFFTSFIIVGIIIATFSAKLATKKYLRKL